MGAIAELAGLGLRYRVKHPDFDSDKSYLALAYIDYGESAWSQILFVNERGMTFAVSVKQTVCATSKVEAGGYERALWRDIDAPNPLEIPKSNLKE